jgi:hypothetical protein
MYSLRHFHADGLLKITLVGVIPDEQLRALGRDLEQALLTGDPEVRSVLVDLTRVDRLDSAVTGQLTELEARLLAVTPASIAQLVGSELVAHQLDRVVETHHTDGRLRHFWDAGPALSWLARPRPRAQTP